MFLTSPFIDQAIAQVCAVCSPGRGGFERNWDLSPVVAILVVGPRISVPARNEKYRAVGGLYLHYARRGLHQSHGYVLEATRPHKGGREIEKCVKDCYFHCFSLAWLHPPGAKLLSTKPRRNGCASADSRNVRYEAGLRRPSRFQEFL
jgi:hypothetical protein